ncbi:MAG: NADH-quinone oxidoreductase subunit K [Gammaproteobacteria bacterium]|nr:NADH-quinone oxidoreductase subunit K [Gammaproteobacteria bacterium]
MSQPALFVLIAAAVFAIGVYGLLSRPQLVRRILALNLMGNGVFLLLVAFARRNPETIDPVPHAMVLTGIVIAVSATAFALAIVRHLYRQTGEVSLGEDRPR